MSGASGSKQAEEVRMNDRVREKAHAVTVKPNGESLK